MKTLEKALEIRDALLEINNLNENKIDLSLNPVPPFHGSEEIKLFIIGQDPTIKNEKTRDRITSTLNLDKNNSLQRYVINQICLPLGLSLNNVYATNIFKYFYTIPPAKTLHVLMAHLPLNLQLLKEELILYPEAIVITLGEPVLQLLTNETAKVRQYWDYDLKTKNSNENFTYSSKNDNKIQRDFYPFPHQPSIRKNFYKNTIEEYAEFVKLNNKL